MEARFRSGMYGGVDVTGKDVPLVPETHRHGRRAWSFAARTPLQRQRALRRRAALRQRPGEHLPASMPDYTLVDLKLEQQHRAASRSRWK